MKFTWEGKQVTLHGMRAAENPTRELHSIKSNMQLEEITGEIKTNEMEAILEASKAIFKEPRGLPPPRNHDHRILLQSGVGLLSVKPYCYLFHQKSEIEKQVEDMLEWGIIKPSNSPYSSPILLVKKGDGT
jgi:hypothetical protein